jgi:hypothetical protein
MNEDIEQFIGHAKAPVAARQVLTFVFNVLVQNMVNKVYITFGMLISFVIILHKTVVYRVAIKSVEQISHKHLEAFIAAHSLNVIICVFLFVLNNDVGLFTLVIFDITFLCLVMLTK